MRRINYFDTADAKKYWDNIWSRCGLDPETVETSTYPLYPTVNYISEKSGLILECGCGTGRVVNFFRNKGFDIVGMDYSEVALRTIKNAKLRAKLVCADALNMPFKEGAFKYICAFGVYGSLQKREERRRMLRQVSRVLDADGLLIFSVAARNTLYYALHGAKQNNMLRRLFGKKPVFYSFGWHQFCKKELKEELQEEGFVLKDAVYTSTHQLFYDLFPFFRKNKGFDRKNAMQLQRQGESVYPFNKIGIRVFSFLNKRFPCIIAQAIMAISARAD